MSTESDSKLTFADWMTFRRRTCWDFCFAWVVVARYRADPQAFVNRLPPLQDLSAHHATSENAMSHGSAGSGEAFREGMEGDEREREHLSGDVELTISLLYWATEWTFSQDLVRFGW